MIQDQWIQPGGVTGFGVFKNWLHSKLEWNVNADFEALKTQFFNAYFMQASATMQKLFDEWLEWAKWQKVLGYEGARSVYYWALRQDMWPKEKLEQWLGYIEQAKKEIEVNKQTDPDLYERLLNHIGMEAIAFKYLMIRLYADVLTADELLALKKSIKVDILKSGITLVNSTAQTTTEQLLKGWGV
jgi:hypothetical protein